jgi:hypothetical protein
MTNHHDIFRNKRDFAREEFATELYKPPGSPRAREPHTQKNAKPSYLNDGIKGVKVSFRKKTGSPES